jgi:heme/copper-type cytochrome/quinol oxidase subunit 2
MLSLMISSAIFLLSFGAVYLMYGRTMEQATWNLIKTIFIVSGILLFLILLIFFTVKFSIQNKKRDRVEKLRGKGNWKIVDEAKWDNFYRLLMIAKNSRRGG